MNPHIDAVPLSHAGRTATIRFTWRALKVLQREWGEDWAKRMVDALTREDVADMAELIAMATQMTVDEVMDWSPPTALAASALWDAYGMTRMGHKPDEAGREAEASNPQNAQSIASRAFALWRSVRASAGRNSGTKPPTQPASH